MKLRYVLLTMVILAAGCAEGAQTDACQAYLECLEARDVQLGISTNADRFESDGDCWGSPTGADLCDSACVRGLEYLSAVEESPSECSP